MISQRDGTSIIRYFVEHYSGRKHHRIVIEELLQFLDENPDVKIVYIAEISRFTRGGGEAYLYLKAGEDGFCGVGIYRSFQQGQSRQD